MRNRSINAEVDLETFVNVRTPPGIKRLLRLKRSMRNIVFIGDVMGEGQWMIENVNCFSDLWGGKMEEVVFFFNIRVV